MKLGITKHNSLLGITIEGGILSVVEIASERDKWEVIRSLREPLSQNILSGNPELVGAEIRKHLDNAGIREKYCVVCLPLSWVYSLQLELPPELSEQDRDSYIHLQAERGFPFAPEDLILSISHFRNTEGKDRATLSAAPVQHIRNLQKVLKAAGLNPKSMTLGVSSLAKFSNASREMSLLYHSDGIDMGIFIDGSPISMRSFSGAVHNDENSVAIDTGSLIRELRITLGSLPSEIRKGINAITIYSDHPGEDILLEDEIKAISRLGMKVKMDETTFQGMKMKAGVSPCAFAAARNHISGKPPDFEFLQPTQGRIKKIMGRVSARRFFWLAISSATVVFLIFLASFIQYQYLASLRRKWKIMEPEVKKVEFLKDQLRKYRPWHDDSVHSLTLLRDITSSFPERGDVWVKSLEIRNLSEAQFSGEARNNKAWLETLSKLRKNSTIEDLKVLQVKEGEGLIQFSVKFIWKGLSNGS
ncbi:pilus assembly protein PilM [Candidatus Sumerlaeota bacterium]|nr:pilus assembly protein PilM [Candidatus Sumerlaeota bacterium]